MSKRVKRTVIIDADMLVYEAALAAEYVSQFDTDLFVLWSDLPTAVARLEDLVHDIKKGLKAQDVVMALSDYDRPNWRHSVLPEYKSNRKRVRRPIVWRALRDYLHDTYNCYQWPSLEGDDVLGILLTGSVIKGDKVAVSGDKDMGTLPGKHLNYLKAMASGAIQWDDLITEVSEAEADRWHLMQTLAGDSTDGYPGCPGIGLVGAKQLLDGGVPLVKVIHTMKSGPRKGEEEVRWVPGEGPADPWEIVRSAFLSRGFGEEYALQTARVARICRAGDYDFDKETVKLWTP